MFASSDEEEVESDAENKDNNVSTCQNMASQSFAPSSKSMTTAGTEPSTKLYNSSIWPQPIQVRSFLNPVPILSPVPCQPVPKKPQPANNHCLLPILHDMEPLVAFLNNLNPGLGIVAPLLRSNGIVAEVDFRRFTSSKWIEYFQTRLVGRGLTAFDEFMLKSCISRYLSQEELLASGIQNLKEPVSLTCTSSIP